MCDLLHMKQMRNGSIVASPARILDERSGLHSDAVETRLMCNPLQRLGDFIEAATGEIFSEFRV